LAEGMLSNEYDVMFAKVGRTVDEYFTASTREAETAKSLLPKLLDLMASDGVGALSDPRYHSLAIVRLLLARCSGLTPADPSTAVKSGSMAALIADRLETSRYGTSQVEEVRARAWALVGNSLRILGDLGSAAVALRTAAEHLVATGGDPLLESEVLSFAASLRDSEGRPAAALPLVDRVLRNYREAGDRRLQGRAFFLKGMLLGNAGRHRQAISSIKRGMALVSWEDEPALVLSAKHNMTSFLAVSGKIQKAQDLLGDTRRLYIDIGDWTCLLRLRWLDGFLARQRGDLRASENLFWMARDGFLEHGLELDAALVMLEIAEGYAAQRRAASARSLAAEVIPVLESYGALRQAEAARRLFQAAG
jgi:tetratricopeptide (TPR) repeat protein